MVLVLLPKQKDVSREGDEGFSGHLIRDRHLAVPRVQCRILQANGL